MSIYGIAVIDGHGNVGTASLALAVKAINVIVITVISVFIYFSFLLVGAPTRTRIGAAEQSNASCSASGFAKQGRILLTGDFADQIFDCHYKQHRM
jgi:hypothetical protein